VIEIHLDGKPVTKLQAARAAATLEGPSIWIGEPDGSGWMPQYISVYARHRASDTIQRPALDCHHFIADTVAEMRQQAAAVTLAAEICEWAEMIAAEQVTEFRTSSTGVTARCRQPGDHGPALEGATLDCDVAAHHEPRPVTWQCTYCWTEYKALPSDKPPVCPECGPLHGPGANAAQPQRVSGPASRFDAGEGTRELASPGRELLAAAIAEQDEPGPKLCEYCDVEPAAEGKYCEACAPAVQLAAGAEPVLPELETTGMGVRLAVCGRHIAMDANGRCDACDEGKPVIKAAPCVCAHAEILHRPRPISVVSTTVCVGGRDCGCTGYQPAAEQAGA
jgi:hypothetical protein